MAQSTNFLPAFLPLFDPDWMLAFAWGGRGGGKSEAIARWLVEDSYLCGGTTLCVREFQGSLNDSVKSLIEQTIESNGYGGFTILEKEIRNTRSGRTFKFYGMQERFVGSIKSMPDIMTCWGEEAQGFSERSLQILLPTIRGIRPDGTHRKGIFSYNRFGENDPIHRTAREYLDLAAPRERTFNPSDIDGSYKWLQYEGHHKGERIALGVNLNFDANPWFPANLEIQRQKAQETPDYGHIWLGEPLSQGSNLFFERSVVRRWMDDPKGDTEGAIEIGVDVGRKHDRTQIYKRKGLTIIDERTLKIPDLVQVATIVAEMAVNGSVPIKIDDTGFGGGVTDMLSSWGYNAIPVDFGQSAKKKDRFANAIAEMWWEVSNLKGRVKIPNDTELMDELCTRLRASNDQKGRVRVSSKDDWKKQFGKSPDKADALLLTYYDPEKHKFMDRDEISLLNEVL
jgi:phage terminase large subunit